MLLREDLGEWSLFLDADRDLNRRLQNKGISSVFKFITTDPISLCQSAGISHQEYQELQTSIYDSFGSPIHSCSFLLRTELRNSAVFPTCRWLDSLLSGGLATGELLELVGTSGSGKTQLCHFLSASVASSYYFPFHSCSSSHTHDRCLVLYIDTSNSAFASRFCDFSVHFIQKNDPSLHDSSFEQGFASDLPPSMKELLLRIRVRHSFFAEDLLATLKQVEDELDRKEEALLSLRLVVIDSLGIPMTTSFPFGSSRDSTLSELSNVMKQIAVLHSIAIVFTNYLVVDKDSNLTPALGPFWSSVANTQLLLKKESECDGGLFSATLTSSGKKKLGAKQYFTIGSRSLPSIDVASERQ